MRHLAIEFCFTEEKIGNKTLSKPERDDEKDKYLSLKVQ
jgi:hypothetical protein